MPNFIIIIIIIIIIIAHLPDFSAVETDIFQNSMKTQSRNMSSQWEGSKVRPLHPLWIMVVL